MGTMQLRQIQHHRSFWACLGSQRGVCMENAHRVNETKTPEA
jgi:hypothetical protein